MARTHQTLVSLFEDIADSIRAKKGTTEDIVADTFPSEIDSLAGKGLMQQEANQLITNDKKSFANTITDTRNLLMFQWRLQSSPYTPIVSEEIDLNYIGIYQKISISSFSGITEFVHNGRKINISIYRDICNVIQNHKYFLSIDVLGANVQVVGGLSLDNMMIIDLTQMFGVGNEPDLETCRKLFANYIPYNTGTIANKNIQQITQDLIKLP